MGCTDIGAYDRNKREHVGRVNRIIWNSPEQSACILALRDGHTIVCQTVAESFDPDTQYVFYGRWETTDRGPRFRVSTWTRESPATPAGIAKWLVRTCDGIGEKLARKLVQHYGAETLRILREEPRTVVNDGFLSDWVASECARALSQDSRTERTRVALFDMFAGRGFPGKLIDSCITKWEAKAVDIIRANPYRLMVNRLPGCGWKRCDKLYLDLGGKRDSLKRQFLAGYSAIQADGTGSTWLDASVVVDAIRDIIGPTCDPIRALKMGERAKWIVIKRDGKQRWIATKERAEAEERISVAIRRLATGSNVWPTELPETREDGDGLPSTHQVTELRKAITKPVGVFCGGPGSGKTHTLSFLLRAIISQHGEYSVCVAAPTGKAAVRASESLAARGIELKAKTIHGTLKVINDGAGMRFDHNGGNPIPFRFVIVDESSMIDTSILADFLDALADKTHVIFVGDPYQLPPVGHGAPFRDLIASGVVGVGELTEIRRNAGLIVRGCAAIKRGESVEFAERFDLADSDPKNLRVTATGNTQETIEALLDQLDNIKKFDRVWETQLIVPLNGKSELSRTALNKALQPILNPSGKRVAKCPFAVGDKIICLENSKIKSVVPAGKFLRPDMAEDPGNYQKHHEKEVEFIANGEIGRVLAVNDKQVVFSFGDDRSVLVPVGQQKRDDVGEDGGEDANSSRGAMGAFDLAYAITVHKSQGSEWPLVIAIIDPSGTSVADRGYWYTAISRARTACLLIGDYAAFVSQCTRQSLARRKTLLMEMLVESFRGSDHADC